MFSRYFTSRLSSKLIPEESDAPGGRGVVGDATNYLEEAIMDLSAAIVVTLCILIFVGGAAWLEIHSRRSKRSGERTPKSYSSHR